MKGVAGGKGEKSLFRVVLRTEDYARAAAPEYRADLNIVTPMLGPEDKKNV